MHFETVNFMYMNFTSIVKPFCKAVCSAWPGTHSFHRHSWAFCAGCAGHVGAGAVAREHEHPACALQELTDQHGGFPPAGDF